MLCLILILLFLGFTNKQRDSIDHFEFTSILYSKTFLLQLDKGTNLHS